MGAHHYRLALLPRTAAEKLSADPECADVWRIQPPEALIHELRQLLAKDTSWDGVEEYASEAEYGSDLRILPAGEGDRVIESIEFRFSPVADDLVLLERFLNIAALGDLLVYS